jgi:hypothetical protein
MNSKWQRTIMYSSMSYSNVIERSLVPSGIKRSAIAPDAICMNFFSASAFSSGLLKEESLIEFYQTPTWRESERVIK